MPAINSGSALRAIPANIGELADEVIQRFKI